MVRRRRISSLFGRQRGTRRDEVRGEWRRMRWAGHVARMGEERGGV